MKILLALLLYFSLLPAVHAQGGLFSNVLRAVTGAVGHDAPAPTTPTATIGVRGHDEDGVIKAGAGAPVSEEAKLIEGWAVGRKEAETAASKRGLVARNAEYEGANQSTPTSAPGPQGLQ